MGGITMRGVKRVLTSWEFWISGPMGCVEALVIYLLIKWLA